MPHLLSSSATQSPCCLWDSFRTLAMEEGALIMPEIPFFHAVFCWTQKVTCSKVSFSPGTLEETQRNFRYCFVLQKNTFLEKKAMEVSNHQVCPFLFNREYLWAKLDYGTMCLHHLWMCHCMQLCFWNSMNK